MQQAKRLAHSTQSNQNFALAKWKKQNKSLITWLPSAWRWNGFCADKSAEESSTLWDTKRLNANAKQWSISFSVANNETLAQHQCLYWAYWSAEMSYLDRRSFSQRAAPSYRRRAAIWRLHLRERKKERKRQRVLPLHSPNPPSITQCGDIAEDKFTFLSYCHPSPPPCPPPSTILLCCC